MKKFGNEEMKRKNKTLSRRVFGKGETWLCSLTVGRDLVKIEKKMQDKEDKYLIVQGPNKLEDKNLGYN